MCYLKPVFAFVALPLLLLSFGLAGEACQGGKSGKGGEKVTAETTRVPAGVWGSPEARVNLNVTEAGAGVDFDCARGVITEPLVIDASKRFSAAGLYIKEHGGPQREGEDNSQPARYSGSLNGKTLQLTIKLTRTDETIGPLTLTFGKFVHLAKCQ